MSLVIQRGQPVPDDHPYKDNAPAAIVAVPKAMPEPESVPLGEIVLPEAVESNDDTAQEPVEVVYPEIRHHTTSIDGTRTSTFIGDISRLHIGKNVEYAEAFFNLSSGDITLCDFVFLNQYTKLISGSHDYTKRNRERQETVPGTGCDIEIGQGVWVGTGATIIGPCTIGDHAVVGAGSVLPPGEYESGCLYAGNPARLIKRIEFE